MKYIIRSLHFLRLVVAIFIASLMLYAITLHAASNPDEAIPKQLFFTENKNQWDKKIVYMSELQSGRLFLEKNVFTYLFINPTDVQMMHPHDGAQLNAVHLHAFKVHFENANPDPVIASTDQVSTYRNYFIGSDSSHWAGNVHMYRTVNYKNIYNGIDLNVYSKRFNLKYDFIVHAGSDASLVSLGYEGVNSLVIDKKGELHIGLSTSDIAEEKPFAYQLINGERKEVKCRFKLTGSEISFVFPHGYNKNYTLIIDPTLVFSSYTGSVSDNWGFSATYDQSGDLYSGGMAYTVGYPVTIGAFQVTYQGGGAGGNGWCHDIVISKFNPAGTSLLFSTYLGGSDNEQPNSLIVDKNDNLLVMGVSWSSDFPVTAGAYNVTYGGNGDIIVAKFNTSGSSLLACTYMGGSSMDGINITPAFWTQYGLKFSYADETRGDIEIDANNNVIVATSTQSPDFPVTAGVLQTTFGGGLQDGVIFKLNNSLSALQFSTFLGGSGDDAVYSCAIGSANDLYVAGGTQSVDFTTTAGTLHTTFQGKTDGFVTHINSNATSILHSTYIGTSEYDQAYFVQLDFNGNVYLCGQTMGAYPVSGGVYSNPGTGHFIHKMSADLGTSFFSTTFGSGSTPNLALTAFLVDTCENIYVAGWGRCINTDQAPDFYPAGSTNGLPVTADAMQTTTDGCDFYFFCLSRDAVSLLYATYFGGPLSMEHVDGGTSRFDKRGTIYEAICGGCWGNSDLTTTPTSWSRTNNCPTGCNLAAVKINFNLSSTVSGLTASPLSGCVPFTANFINKSISATNYIWDFGDGSSTDTSFEPSHIYNDTGTFKVMLVAINNSSCNKADTAYAMVTATPPDTVKASFNLVQSPQCDSLLINVVSTGGGQALNWDFGDHTTGTGTNLSHIYSDTGTYKVTLIASDNVCSVPDTITKSVYFGRFIKAIVDTGAFSGCQPLKIHLFDHAGAGARYLWRFGDGTTSTDSVTDHTYIDTGAYTITLVVVDSAACNISDSANFTVHVYEAPNAGFKFKQKSSYLANENIDFYDISRNATEWLYNFGNGDTSSQENPVYQYHYPGTYNICQSVVSNHGCPADACRTIEIIENEAIFIPNCFTPNGDGVNDYFAPSFVGIITLDVKIFNRWGELIYEWNTLNGHWDGTTHGMAAPEDVYVYKMESSGYVNKNQTKVGQVTLLR